jgi:flagellar basal body-associated protein FliL
MSRLIVSLVVLLVVVVGGLFFLAGSATEQPTTRVEKAVELGNLAS